MLKLIKIKQVDYWIFPIEFFNVVFGAAGLWASVAMFRVPPLVLAAAGNWFIYAKIERSYSHKRAIFHLFMNVFLACTFAWGFYVLTN